jgi:hypothetical protein
LKLGAKIKLKIKEILATAGLEKLTRLQQSEKRMAC